MRKNYTKADAIKYLDAFLRSEIEVALGFVSCDHGDNNQSRLDYWDIGAAYDKALSTVYDIQPDLLTAFTEALNKTGDGDEFEHVVIPQSADDLCREFIAWAAEYNTPEPNPAAA